MTSKPTIHVVAGITWRDNEYLAVERPKGMPLEGWWEFPGGKIEPGETREQALVREFQEELGITPTRFEFWRELTHEYDRYFVQLFFFHVREYSGELAMLEHQRYAWVDSATVPTLKFLPADIVIVQALHA